MNGVDCNSKRPGFNRRRCARLLICHVTARRRYVVTGEWRLRHHSWSCSAIPVRLWY